MISKLSFVLILTFYCSMGLAQSVYGNCRDIGSVTLDEKWYNDISSTSGWKVFEEGEIQPLNSLPQLPTVPEGLKKKQCFTLQVKVKTYVGVPVFHDVPGTCKFNVLSNSYCNLDTKGTPLDNILLFHPHNKVILTDNDKYVFIFSCVNGAYERWAVYIVRGVYLEPEKDAKIQAKIKELGLKKSSGEEQISIVGLKTAKGYCNGMDAIGHGLSLIDVGLTIDALNSKLK